MSSNLKNQALIQIKSAARWAIDKYEDIASERDLKAVSQKKNKGPINVAFIVQMPEVWDKEEPVYLAMRDNPDFNTQLIVVPHYDIQKKELSRDYIHNYFLENYEDAIPGFQNGKWLNLKGKYEYVFYQRPYDGYLPKELRSSKVRKYSKCCYIPYGFVGADVFNEINSDRRFFRNISMAFVETDAMAKLIRSRFGTHDRLHRVECLGYPALEPYFDIKPSNVFKKILWTPRWSYDEKLGGSQFLEYKETIKTIKKLYPEMKITFRPHPLLFEELVSKGLMGKQEIDDYVGSLADCDIKYDTGTPIYDAINDADILITDFSTIIIQYFVTGKPVIYCEAGIKLNEIYEKMAKGFYLANNEEDILEQVKSISNGSDILLTIRRKIIENDLRKYRHGTNAIIKAMYDDARN